jgi:thiamine-monophosphate kinase
MLVSTTDIPKQMSYFEMGRKAVLMNISDLIVKAVKPAAIIISLGLLADMKLECFIELIEGIVDYCNKWDLDYIGGDVNETKELIISPTVFGFQKASEIIFRKGIKPGDYLVSNGKFGLTGVGFDILLNREGDLKSYPSYEKSIKSVLAPDDIGLEAFFLSENSAATASIDSSDGLIKSLDDLIISNPDKKIGFEINFNDELIDPEAKEYSQEFQISLEKLVFNGGEEFIHLFTINPEKYEFIKNNINKRMGNIFKIGQVIPEKSIYIIKNNKKRKLKSVGFEHFRR